MNIIVFDTGTGGNIFEDRLRQDLPDTPITAVIDRQNSPYGTKTPEQIRTLTENALQPYLSDPNNLILIACNTATVNTIEYLRAKYPNITFVGTIPMLKPAATTTKNRHILVLATPATLKSPHYLALKSQYCQNLTVLEPHLPHWAHAIDQNALDYDAVKTSLIPYAPQNPDTIVLGCTHYSAVQPHIAQIFPNATIMNPLNPIIAHIKTLL